MYSTQLTPRVSGVSETTFSSQMTFGREGSPTSDQNWPSLQVFCQEQWYISKLLTKKGANIQYFQKKLNIFLL